MIGFGAFVAFTRIYIGVHYPLDTLVGALAGTAVGMFVRNLPLEKVLTQIEKRWDHLVKGSRK